MVLILGGLILGFSWGVALKARLHSFGQQARRVRIWLLSHSGRFYRSAHSLLWFSRYIFPIVTAAMIHSLARIVSVACHLDPTSG